MILILPFTMRESVNYAIRARLRGEKIVGAASQVTPWAEYCDKYRIIPTIFEAGFRDALLDLIADYDIKRFYSPHHLIYRYVKSMNIPGLEFAEGDPLEIIDKEYAAATDGGMITLSLQCSRIYGHMSEDKLKGMVKCFDNAPAGDALEIGCGWGKSLKAITLLAKGDVYAFDTWDAMSAVQKEAHPVVRDSVRHIDWKLMGKICRANVPEAIYARLPESVSVLHIDGNHDYEYVKKDWELYGGMLVSTGWLILDDVKWPGVKNVWEEIKDGFDKSYVAGGALFARKI